MLGRLVCSCNWFGWRLVGEEVRDFGEQGSEVVSYVVLIVGDYVSE